MKYVNVKQKEQAFTLSILHSTKASAIAPTMTHLWGTGPLPFGPGEPLPFMEASSLSGALPLVEGVASSRAPCALSNTLLAVSSMSDSALYIVEP